MIDWLTPINGLFSRPAGFEPPNGLILWRLHLGGVILYAAQHFLTQPAAAAEAGFAPPFDDLKLFCNIAVRWLVLTFAPQGPYWPGILLILASAACLLWSERQTQSAPVLA